jgi:hypothetical protein
MKHNITHKTTYIGAGAGITLFAVFGIVPGIIAGGALGLMAADMLFGASANAGVLRSLMAVSGVMLGIILGGAVFVMASSILGWLVGALGLKHGTENYGDPVFAQGTRETRSESCDASGDKKGCGTRGLTPNHV